LRGYIGGMAIPTDKCPRCGSRQVINGKLLGHLRIHKAKFVPVSQITLSTIFFPSGETPIERDSCACNDCGLFWSEVEQEFGSKIEV
jgi:hypothetical protein